MAYTGEGVVAVRETQAGGTRASPPLKWIVFKRKELRKKYFVT